MEAEDVTRLILLGDPAELRPVMDLVPTADPRPRPAPDERLRRQIAALAAKLGHRENSSAHAVNIELLRVGFPARRLATTAELRRIRDYLSGRIATPTEKRRPSPITAIVDELRLLPADQLAEVLAHFDRHSAGQSDPS